MDGENNGKPYEQMDDLGLKKKETFFWKHPHQSHSDILFLTLRFNIWVATT